MTVDMPEQSMNSKSKRRYRALIINKMRIALAHTKNYALKFALQE
jgi:hypothetical protein